MGQYAELLVYGRSIWVENMSAGKKLFPSRFAFQGHSMLSKVIQIDKVGLTIFLSMIHSNTLRAYLIPFPR